MAEARHMEVYEEPAAVSQLPLEASEALIRVTTELGEQNQLEWTAPCDN